MSTEIERNLPWGPEERSLAFRPWWRTAWAIVGVVLPVALAPVFVRYPEYEWWAGPLSVVPIGLWAIVGLRRIRRSRAERRAQAPDWDRGTS